MDRRPRRGHGAAALALLGAVSGALVAGGAEPPGRVLEEPPSVAGLARAAQVDDPVFGGQVYVVEAGPAEAQAVVLIHGLGDSARAWYDALPVLAARYRVLTFDLPGFGRSSTSERAYSPENYAALVEALVRARAPGRFHLLGHSMGAAIAIEVVARMPDAVDRLMLLDAAGILEPKALIKELSESLIERRYGADSGFGGWIRETLRGGIQDVPGWADRLARRLLARHNGGPEDSGRRAATELLTHDLGPALDAVRAPTLLVWGEEDRIAPRRTAWALASRLADGRVEVMPGVGHVPMRAGAAFTDLALAWLGGTWRPAAPAPKADPQRDGHCRDEDGLVFEGAYREIRIDSCRDAQLRGVRASRIVIKGSVVRAEDLEVKGEDVAISVAGSELTVSGGRLSGEVALEAGGSDLDLAGVIFEGARAAIETPRGTNLICSLCRLESARGSLHLHAALALAPGSAL